MLERASTCLETGGRQLFRAPKRCLRTRRMLHFSFWHHGASDLNLPAWWTATSILERVNGDDGEGTRNASRQHDGLLLDFLYPEKTLALIRRLSTYSPDAVDGRRRQLNGAGVRQFSTTRWRRRQDQATTKDLEAIQASEEMEERLLRSTAIEVLEDLLRAKKHGKQELAWQLYSTIQERRRTPRLQADLLEYLLLGDAVRNSSRIVEIFDTLPLDHRRSTSYRAAISAYVALKMVGPAIQLHEDAAARFDSLSIGTDAVLRQTIHDDQWDLSLRSFRTFLHQATRLGINIDRWIRHRDKDDFQAVWGEVAQLPDLNDHLHAFLQHVQQFQHELASSEERKQALRYFTMAFVPYVMDQVVNAPNPNEDYIWDFFTRLFRDLHTLCLPTQYCYEHIIKQMLSMSRYRHYTNQRKVFLELYRMYQQECLQEPALEYRPSQKLLRQIIIQHGEKGSLDRVQDVVSDFRTFWPRDGLNLQTLQYLIHCFAEHGDVDHVHEYFDELNSRFGGKVDLRTLSSLVFAYARRVDVPGAVQQFRRIFEEFNQRPDTACWNVLLLAYTRADDLDGALECFNNILESGTQPDKYTFGPLLGLCADRGDIEAFEALYSKARQLKVPIDMDRRARSDYVQAFLSAGDAEGAEAIAEAMLRSWKAGSFRGGSLTHTWNLLIQHYALQGDVASSRRFYRQMVDNNIPLDSWTYAGLMRSLVEVSQTNAAYKILRVTMPMNNVRVHAFHYALVMSGFLRERQYDLAIRAHKRMEERQVPQTESSRQASLLTLGVAELRKMKMENHQNPKARLQEVEEALRRIIFANYGKELAHREPQHSRYIDSHEFGSLPQSYFGLLIMLYNTRGAYDICKQLFEAAGKEKPGDKNYEAPITLLTAIMETHLKLGEHEEVEKCWELARSQVDRLVKSFQQIVKPAVPTPEFDPIIDSSVKERFEQSRITSNRRQILFRTARIYIRSLLAQKNPDCLQQAQRTIRNLLVNGFIIDNLTWNEFIQHLAHRGRLVDAFSACEEYLMPRFPGWRELSPFYTRHDQPGFVWMELRHYDIDRTTVLPRYKTLVVLAAAYAQVKKDEVNGLGFDVDWGKWLREVLEQVAPLTVRAIETMPRTGDRLQRKYIRDF